MKLLHSSTKSLAEKTRVWHFLEINLRLGRMYAKSLIYCLNIDD